MSFITDFFGTGGAGTSLISVGGNLGASAIKNQGVAIKGQYDVELQKLLNDQTKTKAELDTELGRLNATRDAQLAAVNTEQTKLYLGYGLAVVAVIGVAVALVVWIKRM